MPAGDMPTISASNYSNNTYGGAALMGSASFISGDVPQWDRAEEAMKARRVIAAQQARAHQLFSESDKHPIKEETVMPNRRIVQVYIADPSEDVPLADSVLYTGEQKMTDLTDQELFFEIDIRAILAAHNAKRAKIVNKAVKDRTEFLEPAKVRDLKMVVVTVASF